MHDFFLFSSQSCSCSVFKPNCMIMLVHFFLYIQHSHLLLICYIHDKCDFTSHSTITHVFAHLSIITCLRYISAITHLQLPHVDHIVMIKSHIH